MKRRCDKCYKETDQIIKQINFFTYQFFFVCIDCNNKYKKRKMYENARSSNNAASNNK